VGNIGTILSVSLTLYALAATLYLISENRRPQATLAWMLVFIFLPGLGLLTYILFGRNTKAFAQQRQLLHQDLEPNAKLVLPAILSRQETEIARLETQSASRK
jgi:cardiolipin synthase